MLEFELKRIYFGDTFTIGELTAGGEFISHILEDRCRPRGEKIFGQTAIPEGIYDIQFTYSPRFKKSMPELMDVPNFSGVRIHSGNSSKDTEGCLIPGIWDMKSDWVSESRAHTQKIYELIQAAQNTARIKIWSVL